MKALIIDGDFSWGFSVRSVLASAGAQSYPLPPPTTLVGALAAAYARVHTLSEAKVRNEEVFSTVVEIFKYVKWSALYLDDYVITYSDMARLARMHYLRQPHREDITRRFGVASFGKVYGPVRFRAVYLISDESMAKELVRVGFSITSIGSKEGLISVSNVLLTEAKEVSIKGPITTKYYILRRLVNEYDSGTATVVKMPKYPPDPAFYKFRSVESITEVHEDYLIPSMEGNVMMPRKGMKVLSIKDNACIVKVMDEYLVVPK